MALPSVPAPLVEAIQAARCVAFIGAGFTAAAGLPGWKSLLARLAEADGLDASTREHVASVVAQPHPSAHELDRAAQVLEDRLGRDRFLAGLRDALAPRDLPPAMRARLRWLREIPFRAIVTTNFDPVLEGALPGPASYRAILRNTPRSWWDDAFWGARPDGGAPVLKLHGDVATRQGDAVVLTRRDYRRRLYGDPGYMTFLRGLLCTNTVLFMGFSFSDAYLNELRSQVLALFDHRPGEGVPPLGYAIMADVPPLVEQHLADHEGIEVLGYRAADDPGHGGFDRWLEALWERTAVTPRFGRLLSGRRLLWLDPAPDHNAAGRRFLERTVASVEGGRLTPPVEVGAVGEALRLLREARDGGAPAFDLVLTHWGHRLARDDDGRPIANALALLDAMRREDLRAPVVVFCGPARIAERKRLALARGAQRVCTAWEDLFRAFDDVLSEAAPA